MSGISVLVLDSTVADASSDSDAAEAAPIGVGSRVRGVWGAYFPVWEGEVIELGKAGCLIRWDEWVEAAEGWTGDSWHGVALSPPPGGSPIGVFLDTKQAR